MSPAVVRPAENATADITVVRGSPTEEEIAAVVVAFAELRRGAAVERVPRPVRRWRAPAYQTPGSWT